MNSELTVTKPFSLIELFYSSKTSSVLIKMWIGLVCIGQWFFAAYIAVQFGKPFIAGDSSGENFSHMIKGHVPGDTYGNAVLLLHLLPVMLLSLSGVIQLFPKIRVKFPRFHRWNGRMFLTIGLMGALTGLWLTWGRDSRLSDIGSVGVTLNGILIPIAIAFAWYYARQRNFQAHKRWAIHAFILINGVWAFRLMLMGWFMVNQGANGNNSTLDGPADITFSFACYLFPMLVAEIYFWAERRREKAYTLMLNMVLSFTIAVTLIGVTGASLFMWLPRITAGLG